MKKTNKAKLSLVLAACTALTMPGLALAAVQSSEDENSSATSDAETATFDGADIVVTASRRSQSLQDVPMSVDVATGETLLKLNILDMKDVQKLSPGLQLSNSSGRSNTATLRGVTFDPDQDSSPSVDLYLNDVPVDAQTAFSAIYDIEQIEVLRGPQGALRGRTAPAGAITVRSRRADIDDISGYMQATATDLSGYNVQGAVSLPIVAGSLAMRAAVLVDGNNLNGVRNIHTGGKSQSRTQSARLSLRWQPNADIDANLIYQYLQSDDRFVQQVIGSGNTPTIGSADRSGPALGVKDYSGVSEGDRLFSNNSHFVTGTVEWNMGGVTLSALGSYQNSLLTQHYDQDAGNSIPNYVNVSTVISPYKQVVGELRLASNNDGMWNWTLGAFYSKMSGVVTQAQQANTFFGNFPYEDGLYLPIDMRLTAPRNDRNISLSASSRFEFTSDLTFEFGLRYTDQKKKQFADSVINSPGFTPPTGSTLPARPPINGMTSPLVPARLAVGHGKAVTGGATLTYEINRDLTTYLAYGRSFRLGSAGVGVPANLSDDLARSNNERSDAVEFGIKASLLDRRVTANIAAYYQKYDGYMARIPYVFYDFGVRNNLGQPVGAPDGIVDGVFPSGFNYNGDAVVKGIEATITARPTSNFDLSIGAAYSHGRFDNASLPCNQVDTNGAPIIVGSGNVSYCVTNGRIAELPDLNLTSNAELRLPMGKVEPFISTLVTYRPSFSSWRSGYDYDSILLANIYAGVRGPDQRWEFKAFVKNLLNQQRVTNVIGDALIPTAVPSMTYDSGYKLINATQPREFGATMSFYF